MGTEGIDVMGSCGVPFFSRADAITMFAIHKHIFGG
jgi:hypothetical protein